MKRKFSYSIGEMNRRLLAIGKPIRKYIVISTIASILGALSHMGLMGFGALWLLAAAVQCVGCPARKGAAVYFADRIYRKDADPDFTPKQYVDRMQ